MEADYSALHPRLLYAFKGSECPGDPYDVGLDPTHRNWIKHALNALINAQGRIKRPEGYNPETVGMTHKELLKRVAEHHKVISGAFYTGAGLDLQFTDSCIAERILLDLADAGITCLPVHDSFLVQQRHEARLIEAMFSSFRTVVGRELTGDNPDRLVKVYKSDIKALTHVLY